MTPERGAPPDGDPVARLEERLGDLVDLFEQALDAIRDSLGAGERQWSVADLEHLARFAERIRNLLVQANAGRTPDVARTLLEIMRDYDADAEETPMLPPAPP